MTGSQPPLANLAATAPDAAPSGWPVWQRVALRYLTLHWVLYAFPEPFANLWRTVFSLWKRLLPEGASLPAWASDARTDLTAWSEMPRLWWESLLTWLQQLNLTFGAEMIHGATIQSDTCAAWARVACIAVLAGLLTVGWSILDRRRCGHPLLGRWLHLGARWYLALAMLNYAWPKLVGGQFPHPGIQQLTSEVGDLTPSSVLWTFMGRSEPYEFLAGLGELLGFALLLHRRTTLLGAFVTAGVMANVCAMNWLYGVPLKQYSTHLFLISVLLMAPFGRRLWALFVSNGTAPPVDLRVVKSAWLGWPLALVGWLWAVGACTNAAWSQLEWRRQASRTSLAVPELFGLWQVESMQLAGEQVPRSDSSFWRDVAIDRGNKLWIRTLAGRWYGFDCTEDLEAGTITLRASQPPDAELVWQIERSVVTRKGFHPAPRRPEDFRTMVDVERDALTLRGTWEGQPLEVMAVRKVFVYDQPFHLITEWPQGGK